MKGSSSSKHISTITTPRLEPTNLKSVSGFKYKSSKSFGKLPQKNPELDQNTPRDGTLKLPGIKGLFSPSPELSSPKVFRGSSLGKPPTTCGFKMKNPSELYQKAKPQFNRRHETYKFIQNLKFALK